MRNYSHTPTDLVSDRDREICVIVCLVSGVVIAVFGVVANIINITVFYKLGFHNTINISFFGLAVSDLCNLLLLTWSGVCLNPVFINSDISIYLPEIEYLTGGIPHFCFTRITGWITVFITAERCLCILLPLRIKQIVTPRRTALILIAIYILVMVSFYPEYETAYFDWKWFAQVNKTLVGMVYIGNRLGAETIVYFLYSVLGAASFVAVVAFTLIIVIQLGRKSKWRNQATRDRDQTESMSQRDRRSMRMVAVVAVVLIVCYLPSVCVSTVALVVPGLSIFGQYVNLFFVLWSFGSVSEAVNSSINIFFYYGMSAKYRGVCWQMATVVLKRLQTLQTDKDIV